MGINESTFVRLASIKRAGWLWPFIDHINFQKKRALYKDTCIAKYSNLKAYKNCKLIIKRAEFIST